MTQPELAELIKKGYTYYGLEEYRFAYIEFICGKYQGCPLGAAVLGKNGNLQSAATLINNNKFSIEHPKSIKEFIADYLGISLELALTISISHAGAEMTAEEICDKLLENKIVPSYWI